MEVTRLLLLQILDVVKLLSKRIIDVDGDDLPIGLACADRLSTSCDPIPGGSMRTLIDQGHGAEDLDLLDVTSLSDGLADLADVEGILVTEGIRVGVLVRGILPGLLHPSAQESELVRHHFIPHSSGERS